MSVMVNGLPKRRIRRNRAAKALVLSYWLATCGLIHGVYWAERPGQLPGVRSPCVLLPTRLCAQNISADDKVGSSLKWWL